MSLVELVERDEGAEVLVVTNMWPEADRPVYGIFVQRQVESLRQLGVACDVLYIRGAESAGAYPVGALRLAISTVAWRRRYRLVHAHAAEAGLAARCHVGTPVIVSYVGDDVLGDRDESGRLTRDARLRTRLVRAHSVLFAATITKSEVMAHALPGRTRQRNHVVPNGVDRTLFAPRPFGESREALGWGAEPVALFACTKPHGSGKRLWLAEAACRAAGVRLHVASGVAPTEMPVLMSAADCLIVTSAVEGSPNVVKEAIACGLPVIATAVGDIPERTARVAPSWICYPTVEAFSAALLACMERRERSNGPEVAEEFDERVIARRLRAIYEEVWR